MTRQSPLPGPFPLPFIGNVLERDLGKLAKRCQKKYGDMFELYIGNQRLEEMDLSNGITMNNDLESWSFNRKFLINAALSPSFLKSFTINLVKENYFEMKNYWYKLNSEYKKVNTGKGNGGDDDYIIDISSWLSRLSMDITLRTMTGKKALSTTFLSPSTITLLIVDSCPSISTITSSGLLRSYNLNFFSCPPDTMRVPSSEMSAEHGNPMLRDGPTGDWIGTFMGHKGAVWSAKLSKDASRAVTASADFTAKVWDTYTGDVLFSFTHGHIVRSADISDDGTRIVSGGQEKKLRLYDLNKPDEVIVEIEGHESTIKSVIVDGERNVVLSAGDDKEIRNLIFNPSLANSFKTEHPITSMELSADGKYITCTAGKIVYFLDAATYRVAKSIATAYDVSSPYTPPILSEDNPEPSDSDGGLYVENKRKKNNEKSRLKMAAAQRKNSVRSDSPTPSSTSNSPLRSSSPLKRVTTLPSSNTING
ncbi:7382_t:CDS:10 [Entrophospora sp. SA101]|nr:7382_t:CDS:10 [Entrophospora sp. SA101]